MLNYQKISKLNYILYVILSLIILNGCGHKEPALEHKEQKPDRLKKVIESPFSLIMVANIYYAEMGKWPDSIDDLEKLNNNPVTGIDLASIRDSIVFEKLPEGGLKITSTKPDANYTVTIPKPPHFEKSITAK